MKKNKYLIIILTLVAIGCGSDEDYKETFVFYTDPVVKGRNIKEYDFNYPSANRYRYPDISAQYQQTNQDVPSVEVTLSEAAQEKNIAVQGFLSVVLKNLVFENEDQTPGVDGLEQWQSIIFKFTNNSQKTYCKLSFSVEDFAKTEFKYNKIYGSNGVKLEGTNSCLTPGEVGYGIIFINHGGSNMQFTPQYNNITIIDIDYWDWERPYADMGEIFKFEDSIDEKNYPLVINNVYTLLEWNVNSGSYDYTDVSQATMDIKRLGFKAKKVSDAYAHMCLNYLEHELESFEAGEENSRTVSYDPTFNASSVIIGLDAVGDPTFLQGLNHHDYAGQAIPNGAEINFFAYIPADSFLLKDTAKLFLSINYSPTNCDDIESSR